MNNTDPDPFLAEVAAEDRTAVPELAPPPENGPPAREEAEAPAPEPSPKKPAKPKVVPREVQAQQWSAEADTRAVEAAAGIPYVIHGTSMQPFSMARASIMRKVGNAFVIGGNFDDLEDPFYEMAQFILLGSIELTDARALSVDPDELENRVFALMDTMMVIHTKDVMAEIIAYTKGEFRSRVHGESASDEKDKGPKN